MLSDLSERLKDALFRMMREMVTPRLTFLGVYEYVVASQSGKLVDARAADPKIGLPDVSKVIVRPSPLGEDVTFAPGSSIVLAFLNGDPTKPMIIAGDPHTITTSSTIDSAEGVTLGHGLPLPIARATDPVQAGPFSGVIVNGSALNKAG